MNEDIQHGPRHRHVWQHKHQSCCHPPSEPPNFAHRMSNPCWQMERAAEVLVPCHMRCSFRFSTLPSTDCSTSLSNSKKCGSIHQYIISVQVVGVCLGVSTFGTERSPTNNGPSFDYPAGQRGSIFGPGQTYFNIGIETPHSGQGFEGSAWKWSMQ